MPDRGFGAPGGRKWPSPIDLAHRPYNSVCTNVLHCDVKKTYQFKTHSKCDSHSSKTAHIILPGLVIKQRWTTLRLQAKWYSNSLNCALRNLLPSWLVSPSDHPTAYYAALLRRRGPHIASHTVCPSVCPSVPLSLPSVTSFRQPLASRMYFSARTEGRISYGHLGRTDSRLYCADRYCKTEGALHNHYIVCYSEQYVRLNLKRNVLSQLPSILPSLNTINPIRNQIKWHNRN